METMVFDTVYDMIYNRLCDLRENDLDSKTDVLTEEVLLEIEKIAPVITELVLAKEGYICASQEEK